MSLLFEDMIRVETHDLVCRIWRQMDDRSLMDVTDDDLKRMATRLMGQRENSLKQVATVLAGQERVNSVEVVHRHDGCGVCVHKDWP